MKSACDLTPCPTCPWRKENPPGGAGIPGFSMNLMRGLSNTVGDGDAFRPIMACHYSTEDAGAACRGYVARHGWSNLNLRMLSFRGKAPSIEAVIKACRGIKLYRTFAAMLRAFEKARKSAYPPRKETSK